MTATRSTVSWLLGPPFLRLGNIVGEHFAFCIGKSKFFQPLVEGSDCKGGWHVLSKPRIDTVVPTRRDEGSKPGGAGGAGC